MGAKGIALYNQSRLPSSVAGRQCELGALPSLEGFLPKTRVSLIFQASESNSGRIRKMV